MDIGSRLYASLKEDFRRAVPTGRIETIGNQGLPWVSSRLISSTGHLKLVAINIAHRAFHEFKARTASGPDAMY